MKIIYVAGPLRNKDMYGMIKNIAHAWEMSKKLWDAGWAVICPHCNSAFMGLDFQTVIKKDLEIISRCDAVFMLNEWLNSEGATTEHKYAVSKGIPIFYEFDGGIPLPGDIE